MTEATSATGAGIFDNTYKGEWKKNPRIVDLNDSGSFVNGMPHAEFDVIRREYPLYWNEEAPDWGAGFWNVTRHDDIIAVSRDTETFSSAQGINISYGPDADPAIVNAVVGNMISMDPPLHRYYRKIAQPYFTRSNVARLETRIRELAREVLDAALDKGEGDFMADIAAPLPINVLCDILGVPHSDWNLIFDWSNTLIGYDDPDLGQSLEKVEQTFMQLFGYGQQMIQDRRETPRDDLMTAIALAEPEDGIQIPEVYLNGFFLLMVVAGNETTRNSISGGMLALANNPDEKRKMIADPSLCEGSAREEILRWVSPVNHMRRTATRDFEMHGETIREGDKVVMWYGAANRDPDAFENPQKFDVLRDPNPHLAFGIGEHFCLGSRLAQLQLKVLFQDLLRRAPGTELTGDVSYVRTNFINGIKTMPAKFCGA